MHGLEVRAVDTDESPRIGGLSGPAHSIGRPAMRLLHRATVSGIEHVPADGPAIISPNHRSFFDSPLVMAMSPRPIAERPNRRADILVEIEAIVEV